MNTHRRRWRRQYVTEFVGITGSEIAFHERGFTWTIKVPKRRFQRTQRITVPQLTSLQEYVQVVQNKGSKWIRQDRSGSECPWPPFHTALEPSDHLARQQCFDRHHH